MTTFVTLVCVDRFTAMEANSILSAAAELRVEAASLVPFARAALRDGRRVHYHGLVAAYRAACA